MANFTSVPTVATSDAWSAAENNTYLRDNMAALWPYTAAGDIAVADASNHLAVISAPASLSVFTMTSAGVASWKDRKNIGGALHTSALVTFAPNQDFSGAWADITGATVTLTLGVTCTIFVFASVVGYNGTAGDTIPGARGGGWNGRFAAR